MEAKSPVCHNSRDGGTCAGQEREMLVWCPWVGKSPSSTWLQTCFRAAEKSLETAKEGYTPSLFCSAPPGLQISLFAEMNSLRQPELGVNSCCICPSVLPPLPVASL